MKKWKVSKTIVRTYNKEVMATNSTSALSKAKRSGTWEANDDHEESLTVERVKNKNIGFKWEVNDESKT